MIISFTILSRGLQILQRHDAQEEREHRSASFLWETHYAPGCRLQVLFLQASAVTTPATCDRDAACARRRVWRCWPWRAVHSPSPEHTISLAERRELFCSLSSLNLWLLGGAKILSVQFRPLVAEGGND